MDDSTVVYDDGRIVCDEEGLVIGWYYLWGKRRIPYHAIRSVTRRRLRPLLGKWRLWGSHDFVHWYNLDGRRPTKRALLEINLGKRVRPMITPDDPDMVQRIISEHIAA